MKGSVIMIRAGTRELIYDRVDRVLQFQNLAFYADGNFLGQIAHGDGCRYRRDDLLRKRTS